MALTLITAPATPVISLDDARDQLRVIPCGSPATSPDDDLIQAMVEIATSELDGVDGWLGRALITQTWLLTLDRFPPGVCTGFLSTLDLWRAGRIPLPLTSPKYSGASPAPAPVAQVAYTDTNGDEQVLVEGTDYRVVTDHDPILIEPVFGKSWPATRDITGAVRITYDAGYGDAATDVPPAIRGYLKYRLGQLYEFREMVLSGTIVAVVPHVRDMLENFRMRGLT